MGRFLLLALTLSILVASDARPAIVVNSAADPGDGSCTVAECTFREALSEAQTSAPATITFAIPGAGPHAITLSADLMQQLQQLNPTVPLSDISIDGYTQPGAQPNTAATGSNAVMKIVINGNGHGGLVITHRSIVRGLVMQNFGGAAIRLRGDDSVVAGCFLGTDVTGTVAQPNTWGVTVYAPAEMPFGMPVGQQRNRIGGPALADRNVISGNLGIGVAVWSFDVFREGLNPVYYARLTTIEGNLIGVSASSSALGNRVGVDLWIAINSTLRSNVISGNAESGVRIGGYFDALPPQRLASMDNVIIGNLIGTSPDGTTAIANGTNGVVLGFAADRTVVGGSTPAERNVISGNAQSGISIDAVLGSVIAGNFIGVDVNGNPLGNGGAGITVQIPQTPWQTAIRAHIGGFDAALGNLIANNGGNGVTIRAGSIAVLSNRIGNNAGLAIDLNDDGVTPNDPLDSDTGPNGLQNYPVITSVFHGPGGAQVAGSLDSTPSTPFKIQLFDTETPPQLRLSYDVTTDASGHAEFSVVVTGAPPAGLSATATNMTAMTTSEVSPVFIAADAAVPLFSPATLMLFLLTLSIAGVVALARRV